MHMYTPHTEALGPQATAYARMVTRIALGSHSTCEHWEHRGHSLHMLHGSWRMRCGAHTRMGSALQHASSKIKHRESFDAIMHINPPYGMEAEARVLSRAAHALPTPRACTLNTPTPLPSFSKALSLNKHAGPPPAHLAANGDLVGS